MTIDALERLDIRKTVEHINRHRVEDNEFWANELPGLSAENSRLRLATLLARCMGERTALLRLMGQIDKLEDRK